MNQLKPVDSDSVHIGLGKFIVTVRQQKNILYWKGNGCHQNLQINLT